MLVVIKLNPSAVILCADNFSDWQYFAYNHTLAIFLFGQTKKNTHLKREYGKEESLKIWPERVITFIK